MLLFFDKFVKNEKQNNVFILHEPEIQNILTLTEENQKIKLSYEGFIKTEFH